MVVDTQTLTFPAIGTVTNNSSQGLVIGSIVAGAATSLDLNAIGGGITLSAVLNTYGGITNVNSGTVTINNNGSLGVGGTAASRTVIAAGARVSFNNTPRTYTERFEIAGAGVGGTTGALTNSQTATTVNGLVTLSAAATSHSTAGVLTYSGGFTLGSNALTFNVAGGTQTVQTAGITGIGGSVVKTGNGTLNLSATNTYDGGSTVSGGTLFFINTGAKPTAGTHTFAANTTLGLGVAASGTFFTSTDITNAFAGTMDGNLSNVMVTPTTNVGIDTTAGNFTYSGSIAGSPTKGLIKTGGPTLNLDGINTYTGATSVLAGQLTLNGSLTGGSAISVSGAATIFQSTTGVIGGISSYTQGGTGVSTLTGNNTYDGGTTINGGTLNINSATALGTGALTLGGGIIGNTSLGVVTLSNNNVFNINADTTFTNANSLSNGTGNFTINGTRIITVTANRLTLGGNQTAVVAGGITKAGAGVLALLGSGAQTGAATITAGVLEAGVITNGSNPSSLGNTSSAATTLIFGAAGATLRHVGATDAITDRSFTLSSGGGGGATIESSGAGTLSFSGGPALAYGTTNQTRTLTLGGSNIGNNTFGKLIANNTGVAGTTTLTKTGAGKWILSQNNTYTGATNINGGTLVIAGDTQSTSAINFNNGGVLGLNVGTTVAAAGATVDFTGQSVLVTGTTGDPSYTLLTALSIPGTAPMLAPGSVSGYTLQVVSNQLRLIQNGTGTDPNVTWSSGAAFGDDANNDGIDNGLAWVLGALNPAANAVSLLPILDNTADPNFFIFTYRRDDDANTDPNTTLKAEYSSDLAGWTPAVASGDIIITPTDEGAGVGIDLVQVKIRRTLAVGGKLFARLNAVKAP